MRSAQLRLLVALAAAASACGRGEKAASPPSPTSPSSSATLPAGGSSPAAGTTTADAAANPLVPCPVDRASLGPGLTVERWPIAAKPAAGGPACVDVVRADPAAFKLTILSQATDDPTPRTALTWRDAFHLSAVINAGMFHESGKPVGMIISDGTLRSADNPKMSGFLAWDPVTPDSPPFTIAGRDCADFDLDSLRAHYHSIVQSYRLLGCDSHALPWKDPKHYSAAAIALDRSGRLVFLHARAAVTMADLSAALAAHDLTGALFLEGGPEASLVARGPDAELSRVGSFETGFVENDSNVSFWTLPNVIALLPR